MAEAMERNLPRHLLHQGRIDEAWELLDGRTDPIDEQMRCEILMHQGRLSELVALARRTVGRDLPTWSADTRARLLLLLGNMMIDVGETELGVEWLRARLELPTGAPGDAYKRAYARCVLHVIERGPATAEPCLAEVRAAGDPMAPRPSTAAASLQAEVAW